MDILIGVLASLVATIIWVAFTQLYDFNSRRNISFLLELLYDCACNFDTAIEFSNLSIAETETDKILGYCKEIFDNIKFFTYAPKKKKFVYTILYNVYYTISYYKRLRVGYQGTREQEAKLSKFKQKYYYRVHICGNERELDEEWSFLKVSVVVLQSLNRRFSVKKALKDNLYVNSSNTNLVKTYSELVAAKNFKSTYSERYDLRKSCFTEEEYLRYISKKVGAGGTK